MESFPHKQCRWSLVSQNFTTYIFTINTCMKTSAIYICTLSFINKHKLHFPDSVNLDKQLCFVSLQIKLFHCPRVSM
jgi:hypothetical protein